MPKRTRKLDAVHRWIDDEWTKNEKPFNDDPGEKIFASDRACSAVFVALMAIAFEASENDDECVEGACFCVMEGLAKGRLAYLKEQAK